MTRPEKTGIRDLTFSAWIRESLPSSASGLMVSDIDFILQNYKSRKVMILEIKTRSGKVKSWQRMMYKNLHRWLSNGIDGDWIYLGIHLITFENTSFSDGLVYLDNEEITEQELINFLSI